MLSIPIWYTLRMPAKGELCFITGSADKAREAGLTFPSVRQLDIDLPEIQHTDPQEIIRHKLEEARKLQVSELIVEDTGLYLECLNGLPGPLVKWFLKSVGNEGLARIAESLGNPRAEAKTVVGYANGGEIHFFEGAVKGRIVAPRGDKGFGWDPIFEPEGANRTFAEMTPEEKNKFNMRRIAFEKLRSFLE